MMVRRARRYMVAEVWRQLIMIGDIAADSVDNLSAQALPAYAEALEQARAYLSQVRERFGGRDPKEISPCHHVKKGAPPTIIFHGKADTTVPYATAEAFAQAMKQAGNHVTSLISARSKDILILEDEMAAHSDVLKIATDDGTAGFHGYPTQILQKFIDEGEKIDIVFAVGPVPAMAAVCKTTKPYGIKTIVSLNPIMVDGTGMCGACRVTVDGKTRFACVEGPEFDGHKVDFDELITRLNYYKPEEQVSLSRYHQSKLESPADSSAKTQ